MPWDEYCNLLSGLKEDTPLVKMALVRTETDPEVIKTFTAEQKRINYEWRRSYELRCAEYNEAHIAEDDGLNQITKILGSMYDP